MNLSALTLTQLRYVLAIAEHGSFRGAAQHCGVTQPALSAQVHKLESLLGARLFDRSHQPLVVTPAGERVLAQARVVLRETERLADAAHAAQGRVAGRFRLGIIPSLAPSVVPRFLGEFAKRHPLVELDVSEHQTDEMLRRLHADELGAGIAAVPLEQPRIHETPLFREELLVYLPPRHRWSRRASIPQSELVDEPVWLLAEGHCYREQVLHLCRADRRLRLGRGRGVHFEGGSFDTLIGLVDRGAGMTILPELTVRDLTPSQRRRVRPFSGTVPVREVGLLRSRTDLADPIVHALTRCMRESLRPAARSPCRTQLLAPVTVRKRRR